MTSLREELGARPNAATPYTILCPPGWRRVAPSDVADGAAAQSALAAMKSAGRADLVLQVRGMLSRYRAAVRESNAFDAYLAPLIDGVPIPASMIVAPLVLPPGVSWEQALARLSRGADVAPLD
ncbi:MAG: hypothetical protein KKH75_03620, partial [Actinobacteria bacterium]|nr:hypothetical protein [Actinomycetota bacterium]